MGQLRMIKPLLIVVFCLSFTTPAYLEFSNSSIPYKKQFLATSDLLDASINSLNSLNSLIKKENYRNKITAFNNRTTSDLGFSLETEIQNALKPILEKAKNTNTNKSSAIISSLLNNPVKNQLNKTVFGTTSIFISLISVVGNLAISKKIQQARSRFFHVKHE